MQAMLVIALLAFLPMRAWARVFYADPVKGAAANDGSKDKPWRTAQEVFARNLVESRQYAAKPAIAGAPMIVKNPGRRKTPCC